MQALEKVTINIDEWKTPATEYPEKTLRSARIKKEFYKEGFYLNYGIKGYEFIRFTKPIIITSLELKKDKKWETWMVDDPPHWWSMQLYAERSMGKVLVGGLGLGLIIHTLIDNVDIDSITIIEKNKDVIDLICPFIKKNDCSIKIINKDFYDFIHESEEQFDRLIIDLWVSSSKEETMRLLESEVRPLSYYLKMKYPDASVVFHGFGIEW